jgi:hypothetical protein
LIGVLTIREFGELVSQKLAVLELLFASVTRPFGKGGQVDIADILLRNVDEVAK